MIPTLRRKEKMPRPSVLVLTLAVAPLLTTAAFACGDKLMLLVGNVRFRQLYGARPAAILAYVRQNSAMPGLVVDLEQQPALKRAGHKVHVVDNLAKFEEALRTGTYDLVLADAADADSLAEQVSSAPSKPVLLPVVFKSAKPETVAAEKKYRRVLKTPNSPNQYLATIDEAMDAKSKNGSAKAARR
jgi:hypothetical protein